MTSFDSYVDCRMRQSPLLRDEMCDTRDPLPGLRGGPGGPEWGGLGGVILGVKKPEKSPKNRVFWGVSGSPPQTG